MGLEHDERSFFDARTFDRYATKLQNKEDKVHRNASRISTKLSHTREEVGTVLYGKETIESSIPLIGQATAGFSSNDRILLLSDDAFEREIDLLKNQEVEKNSNFRDNKKFRERARKQIAEKYGVSKIVTETEKRQDVKKLHKKARRQEENMRGRVRLESKAVNAVSKELDDMAGAREKDTGTEAIEMTDKYAKKGVKHLAYMAFMPDSVYQSRAISKLGRKESKLQKKYDRHHSKEVMAHFYSNVHQNEAAVLHGFDKDRNARLEALRTKRERLNQTGSAKNVKDIVKNTEKDQAIIRKNMQKRRYRKQYAKAVYATGASAKTQSRRDNFLNLTSRKNAIKEKMNKLLPVAISGVLMLIIGMVITFMAGYVVYMLLADSTYSTNWLTITDVTDYFTKAETDYCPDILATKVQDPAQADEFHWYFSDGTTKTEVTDEKALVDKWCEVGQISQLKIVSFISTFYRDYELADCQDLLDTLLSRIYSLEVEIVEEPSGEGELCGCGCNSDPPAECGCGGCDGTLDPEMIKVQYVTFTQRNIDEVVEELYAEMAGSEADDLKRYYELYQVTRGSNISLANPLPNHFFTDISSFNGYRIRTDKDYEIEYHKGLDIASREGVVLFAPTDCTIIETGYSDSMGNYVIMETEDGMQIRYMHCYSILCETGDKKKRSYRVARVGNTGESTGPHLHMDVRVKDEDGNYVYVNPLFAVSDNLQWDFTEARNLGGSSEE